ncbi:MAG: hypothetical protein V4615_13695 [Bacteroidota bacterium]
MSCSEATLAAQKRSEGKLSISDRLGLWLHLAACSLCRLFVKQSEIIASHASKLGEQQANLTDEKKRTIAESLNLKMKNNA